MDKKEWEQTMTEGSHGTWSFFGKTFVIDKFDEGYMLTEMNFRYKTWGKTLDEAKENMKSEVMKDIKTTEERINNLIKEIELDYVEYVEKDLQRREKLLPLTKESQIYGLIWNLLTNEKFRSQISVNDYNQILSIWFNRLHQAKVKAIIEKIFHQYGLGYIGKSKHCNDFKSWYKENENKLLKE